MLNSRLLVFLLQVNKKEYSTFKYNDSFLVVLPSAVACCSLAVGRFNVAHGLFLLLGSIESNPGPDTKAMLAEILRPRWKIRLSLRGANTCQIMLSLKQ